MKMKIRRARRKDLKKMYEIVKDCIEHVNESEKLKKSLREEYTLENLEKAWKKSDMFVLELSGVIRACGRLKSSREIKTIYVDPKIHRNGFGSVMIKKIESLARKKGHRRVFIHALPSAVGFYKKLGFERMKDDDKLTRKMGKGI